MRKFLTAGACVLFSAGAASAATSKPNYDAWLDSASVYSSDSASVRTIARQARISGRGMRGYVSSFESRLQRPGFLWFRSSESIVPSGIGVVEVGARPEFAARKALESVAGDLLIDRDTLDAATLRSSKNLGHGAVIASFAQTYQGVEVFGRSLSVAMRQDYSPVAVSGYFDRIPRVDNPPAGFAISAGAVIADALADVSDGALSLASVPGSTGSAGGYEYFSPQLSSGGDYRLTRPVRVRRVYYPLNGELVPAWYLELFGEVMDGHSQDAYGYVVSATDGAILFRKNLTEDAAFGYRVFGDTVEPFRPFDGPLGNERAPLEVPDPDFPVDRISAEAGLPMIEFGPISSEDPWLLAGDVETSGNNVDAYLDKSPPDGYTADSNDLRAQVTSGGIFDYAIAADDDPDEPEAQSAAAVNLFYLNNWMHDSWYDSGFDEASGNAQFSNYGRGGVEGDPIRAEGQDYSGRNNANMSTPADGGNPRMQMFLWSGLLEGRFEVLIPALGEYPYQVANFGPRQFAVQNQVVIFDDATIGEDPVTGATGTETDGCESAANASALRGRIALIDRGFCDFVTKVMNAQAAGALGALIVDNVVEPPIAMGGGPVPSIVTPSMFITLEAGNAIRDALVDGPVTVVMERVNTVLIDGTIDYQIVSHEWFHYASNRLVGNASGLSNAQGRGMGEGWSDFNAMMLTVRESDLAVPANPDYSGVYAVASYVVDDPYFGIRRAPYSTNFDYNPLTFEHIENGVPLPDTAPLAFGADGASNAEVHNSGEIWTNVLWEAYAALLNSGRYSFGETQQRMKDYVIGGLKMTPNAPTFLEARDGVLAVAAASDPADFELIAGAFAKRGMGVGAVAPDRGDDTNSGVVESYVALGTALAVNDTSFDMSLNNGVVGYCDTDEYLDLDEGGLLWITLDVDGNVGLDSGLTAQISADGVDFFDGATLQFPPAEPGTTTSAVVGVHLTAAESREYKSFTLDFVDPNPDDAVQLLPESLSFDRQVDLDLERSRATDDFEQIEATLNDWATEFSGAGDNWAVTDAFAGTFGSAVYYVPDNGTTSDAALISPDIAVGSEPFTLSFKHYFAFELNQSGTTVRGYDGGVIEISIDGGAWTDIFETDAIVTEGSGYNGSLRDPSRPAFVGELNDTETLEDVTLDFGTSLAGSSFKIRFRQLTDPAVGAFGWVVDNVSVIGAATPPFLRVVADDHICVARGPVVVAPDDFATPEREEGSREQATITMTATANDLDGDPLAYTWQQIGGPAVSLVGADSLTASFVAPAIDADTVYRFRFTASDGTASASDVVAVTVENVETSPLAIAPDDFSAPERAEGVDTQATIALDGSATDPDGSEIAYLWTQTDGPNVEIEGAALEDASFVAPLVDEDTALEFTLTASDDSGSTSAVVVVTVLNVDSPPVALAPDDFTVSEREGGSDEQAIVSLEGSAEDPDGDEALTFKWVQTAGPSVELQNATERTATFATPPLTEDAMLTFVLTVSDGIAEDSDDVTVTVVDANASPHAIAPDDFTTPERADGSRTQAVIPLVGSATDADSDEGLNYRWQQTGGSPVVMSNVDSATASFTAPSISADSSYVFTLTVDDGLAQTIDTVTVTVTNVESPALAVVPADFSTPERGAGSSEQATISIAGGADDPDGLAGVGYEWTQVSGPVVELMNTGTPTLSFVAPLVSVDSALGFALTVTDPKGSENTAELAVTVLNIESPPTAIAPDDFSAPERASEAAAGRAGLVNKATQATITLDGDGTDPDGDELSYAWTQTGGPSVELIDADSEDASFVAPAVTADTPLTFVLTVSDGTSEHADEVVVTILNVNAAPVAVAAVVGEDFEAGDTVTLDGSGSSDPDDEPFVYAWTQTDGPEVTLSDASAAMPTFVAASAGTYGFSLSVTDEEGASSTATTTLTVAAAPAPPPVDNDNGGGGDGGAFGLATLAGLAALLALRRRRVFGHSLH